MPLLDLKTDLKSLKYGQDQSGGGSSGQPYIQTDINSAANIFNRFMIKADDGLVRGGAVGAFNASVIDTIRIGKFLKDFPKGPLFIAKQVGLQLSNPRLEAKSEVTGFFQSQPTRIYNLGLNTLAQVPVNAFGVHFNRHGLLPIQDDQTKYLAVAQSNNQNTKFTGAGLPFKSTNRLVQKAIDLLPPPTKIGRVINTVQSALLSVFGTFPSIKNNQIIDDYTGGPGSIYGIGRTVIKRYDYTSNRINKQDPQEKGKVNYLNVLGVSKDYLTPSQILSLNNISNNGNTITPPPSPIQYKNPSLKKYSELKQKVDQNAASSSVYAYNPFKNTNLGAQGFAAGDLYNGSIAAYTNNSIVYKNGIDSPIVIKLGKTNATWKRANRENRVGSGRQDQINLTPIFSSPAGTIVDSVFISGVGVRNINDLVKFRIQALNGNNPNQADWMIFRAYLTQLTDNTNATWNETKYIGRGEKFYIYDGFTRKIQIGFKVAALSAEEMKPMYQKLNYLMGNLMPDYEKNIMRGPLVRMTVGNWIDGQTGVLDSLSYTIPNDSPWEIAINEPGGDKLLILPHVVEVQLSFTPIGSQTRGANLVSEKSFTTSHIAQNINDYQYITGSIKPAAPSAAIAAAEKIIKTPIRI